MLKRYYDFSSRHPVVFPFIRLHFQYPVVSAMPNVPATLSGMGVVLRGVEFSLVGMDVEGSLGNSDPYDLGESNKEDPAAGSYTGFLAAFPCCCLGQDA
jgi:hypothetical protein